ncbi:hypothetical protein AXFE_04580 [Acidithrix ferrooxidans]|uniref:Transposase n=1 Tax=Acidithrix ferrooxidans TaxID=1280514 RepID=A0A0D8HLN8_9ACTN|nr:hypothetical protein AXFE_04580 [Acidithrix ferrooxidans]
MILYPKDQKEAVIRKIRTLLSDPSTLRGAFSQLAKESKIPSATIYQWKKEVEADLISQEGEHLLGSCSWQLGTKR